MYNLSWLQKYYINGVKIICLEETFEKKGFK